MNRYKRFLLRMILVMAFLPLHSSAQPKAEHGLDFDTPVTTWDEALPLGNGLLGALVWGDGKPMKISLDRTDLWDLRPVPEFESEDYSYERMRQWVKEGRIKDLHALYDHPYGNAGPTKIPAGRIELSLGKDPTFEHAALDLEEAVVRLRFKEGIRARILVHAVLSVGLIEVIGDASLNARLKVPPFAGDVKDPAGPNKISAGDLATLGYEPPLESSGPDWTGYLQEGWGGFRFAVVLAWRRVEDRWIAAWSIATSTEGRNPLETALIRCKGALDVGFDNLMEAHQHWWTTFWSRSSIRVPNPIVERQWYLETYKFGAAAREDTPPITLQGPWTADNGKIPPWKGDYHHDLNTELSYWPCYAGNRLEGGLGFLNWLWKTRENGKKWTARFFKKPGLNVPMTADLNGNQIGGWHQYTHSATTAAWLAHHFYLHWRYSMDRDFLGERAYPYLKEAAIFLEAVTERGEDGLRTLPLSSSPEINDNRLDAWFPSITNYDLALIRWLFGACRELAEELGEQEEAARWKKVLAEMPSFTLDPGDRRLYVAKEYPLKHSHRHFSHLMAIHPLSLIRWEGGEADRATISAALAELDRLGTDFWTGYSFSWLACLAARGRDGARAEEALEIFSQAFCLRNGFHCNGDQSGKGYSKFTYRPFTLEGNFAAAAGVQEMLLQSHGGVIRLFPALPDSWRSASFRTLRAEGAFLVSAEREDGLVRRVEIFAEREGTCRMADPFKKGGEEIRVPMIPGQKILLERP